METISVLKPIGFPSLGSVEKGCSTGKLSSTIIARVNIKIEVTDNKIVLR